MFWALLVLGISAYMSIGHALGQAQKKTAKEWEKNAGKINPVKKYLFYPFNAFGGEPSLKYSDVEPPLCRDDDAWALMALVWPFKFLLWVLLANLFYWSSRGLEYLPKTPIKSFAKYCLYYPLLYAPYVALTSPARILKMPKAVKAYLEKRKEKKALKAKQKEQKLLTEAKAKTEQEDCYTLRQSVAELETELARKKRLLVQKENELAREELVSVSPNSRDADRKLLAQ